MKSVLTFWTESGVHKSKEDPNIFMSLFLKILSKTAPWGNLKNLILKQIGKCVYSFYFPLFQLPMMEHYAKGRAELYVTLTRVFFLRMTNLFALIITLYRTIQEVRMYTELNITLYHCIITNLVFNVI